MDAKTMLSGIISTLEQADPETIASVYAVLKKMEARPDTRLLFVRIAEKL